MIGKPVMEKFLERNYLFAMETLNGFIFGRTIRRRICNYKPWKLIDDSGNNVDVSATGHAGEYRFRDPRDVKDDILYLDTATDSGYPWFYHGAIGITPEQVRMYIRYPEGKELPGQFPKISVAKAKSGDKFSYVTSNESPYYEPTDFVELVILPGIHISAEYYNIDSADHQPVMNLLFALYHVELFDPKKPSHMKMIRDIATRKLPATYLTAGFNIPIEMPSDWEQFTRPITLKEATGV